MDKLCIITTTGTAKEMYSCEAKSKGHLTLDSPNMVPGYEITFEDDSTLWFSILEFNRLAIFTKKEGCHLQECPSWADDKLKEMFLEFNNLKEKIIEVKKLIEEDNFDLENIIIKETFKLQYNFMLGYLNCLGDRIYHYYAINDPDMPTLEENMDIE